MDNTKINKKIGILDWLIFISIITMFIMVYVPQSIWEEENTYKKERREKMKVIATAEEFYKELTGEYTIDYMELFNLVESAMDSLIADSLFTGRRNIDLNNINYKVDMAAGFHTIVDTTFSSAEKLKKNVMDSIFTITMNNEESSEIDTILVNSKSFKKYKSNPLFIAVINIETDERMEVLVNHLRRKFHLNDNFIYCPISKANKNKKFILEIEETSDGSVFKISSPLTTEDAERRYLIFKYNPGKQESIIAGKKSWAEN